MIDTPYTYSLHHLK